MSTTQEHGDRTPSDFQDADFQINNEAIAEKKLLGSYLDLKGITPDITDKERNSSNALANKKNSDMAELSLKMEIDVSQECTVEPNLDYSYDDVIEICTISESEEECENLPLIQKDIINCKELPSIRKQSTFEDELESDEDISVVMNDHNYSSQEDITNHKPTLSVLSPRLESLDDTSQSGNSVVDEKEAKDMNEFLNDFVEEDSLLKKKQQNAIKIKPDPGIEATNTERENFLQDVMNALAAEDSVDDESVVGAKKVSEQAPDSQDEPETTKNTGSISDKTGDRLNDAQIRILNSDLTLDKKDDESKVSNNTKGAENEKFDETETYSLQPSVGEENRNTEKGAGVSQASTINATLNSENNNNNIDGNNTVVSKGDSMTVERGSMDKNKNIATNTNNSDESSTEKSSNDFSLPENCSEPIEMAMGDEYFEQFDMALDAASSTTGKLPLLNDFFALVKQMNADCESFTAATNDIESKLIAYVQEKFEIMRELVQRNKGNYVDQAQQTEPLLSKEEARKLERKNKAALLASDSSSFSSFYSTSDEETETRERKRKSHRRRKSTADRRDSEDADKTISHNPELEVNLKDDILARGGILNTESLYDDGVALTKYLRSDIFSVNNNNPADNISIHSSLSSLNSSDDENRSKHHGDHSTKKSTAVEPTTSDKVQKSEDVDENDKEIERLTNLDGLLKRHKNAGSSNQTDLKKSKGKVQNSKNKTDDVLKILEQDLEKESQSSDESVNEDADEDITEKQYLERCNQELKLQFLNESSNESSQAEDTENEFRTILSDESDGGNRSPLVDKFLKAYNIDDSEDDDEKNQSKGSTSADMKLEMGKSRNDSQSEDDTTEISKINETDKTTTITSENSDCELLTDNFITQKRKRTKSLEKILSEAEKRKKIRTLDEDLISLSSESDNSDVEAVDVEPEQKTKSRAIKPMLRPEQLHRETVKAQKNENERIRRLEKRQVTLSRVIKEHKEINKEEELILDYNEETKTFIKVHPELVKHLKPHQRDGVRFMFDSCYGGVDAVKKNHGSGCILAHCMGLGKTLQLIALMHTVVTYKELKTNKVLVLCPKSTVMNWNDEILRWLLPLRERSLKVYTFSDTSDINEKLSILREWSTSPKAGCLLIGYEAFRTLVFYHKYKIRNNLDASKLEKIRDEIEEYLLQPGADLVVCDEGHIIKNSKSAISMAVAEIKTQKRIVLTGTPIQNNLKEYYSMVNFIKPLFLGTEKEFANMYANPIKNGQHKDSSKKDIKIMKQRSFVLHKKLSKFVQRKEAELLKSFLPEKFEYVLFIPMSEVQNKLYEHILEIIKKREDNRGRSLITDYTCLRKIWTHPKVLEDAWKNATNQQFKRDARKQAHSDDDQPDDIYDSQTGTMSVKNDWWRNLIHKKDLESILPSNKLRTMFEILRMCMENGDKCLIFSAFVAVLNVVEYFFHKITNGDSEILNELNIPPGNRPSWLPNKDYFRLDGKTSKATRHEMIKHFNRPENTRARVFLISAKAGGQGINLTGANRVIILDTSWNPSNDQQNIFRVFRLGQQKKCFIYRLLAMGTMEEKVYSRSVTKQAMSFRVMDVHQIDRHYNMAELAELYTLTKPQFSERPTPIFPQDSTLANLLRSFPDLVYRYHEHDSLLENKIEQELSEEEKRDAWAAYEQDLQQDFHSQLTQMQKFEELQNRFNQGQMPNYMPGSTPMPGFDFQSFINMRSGINPQSSQRASTVQNPFFSPILQPLGYNLPNSQYLDLLNLYRKYSSGDNAAYNAYGLNSSLFSVMPPPAVAHQHNSGASSSNNMAAHHPLSALNDLSMYGLGMNSSGSSPMVAAPVSATSAGQNKTNASATNSNNLYAAPSIPSPLPAAAAAYFDQLQHLGYNFGAAGSNKTPANSALSPFANTSAAAYQFPRRTPPQTAPPRKSTTPDLSAYRNNSGNSVDLTSPATITAVPKSVEQTKPTNNSVHMSGSSIGNMNEMSITRPETWSRQSNKTPTSIISSSSMPPTTFVGSTYTNARGSTSTTTTATTTQKKQTSFTAPLANTRSPAPAPSNVNSKSNSAKTAAKTTDPQIRVKDMEQLYGNASRSSTLQAAAAAAATGANSNSNAYISNVTSNKNTINSNASTSKQSMENSRGKVNPTSAAELLKARSGMQIIPTTSPPGTASISKQLSEISPSISLTALNNTTTTSSSKTTNMSTNSSSSAKLSTNPNSNTTNIVSNNNKANRNSIFPASIASNRSSHNLTNNVQQIRKQSATTLNTPNSIANNPNKPMTMATSAPKKAIITIPPAKLSNSTNSAPKLLTKSSNSNSTISQNRVNVATPSVATSATTTTLSKNAPSPLRQQYIRKIPAPVSIPSVSNVTTTYTANTIANQSSTSNNSKQISANKIVSGANLNSTAQIAHSKGNAVGNKKGYAPLLLTPSSKSASEIPATASNSVATAPRPQSSGSIIKKQPAMKPPVPTTASSKTNMYPVHLQRSNTSVNLTRSFSPQTTPKITPGVRSNSSTSLVGPKIASVTSLTSLPSSKITTSGSVTPSSSSAAAVARLVAMKKQTNTSQHNNGANLLVQQKRTGLVQNPQQQQRFASSSPVAVTKISTNRNLNIRPIIKNVTPTSSALAGQKAIDKRILGSSTLTSAPAQSMLRTAPIIKRKANDDNDIGNPNKRPKDF